MHTRLPAELLSGALNNSNATFIGAALTRVSSITDLSALFIQEATGACSHAALCRAENTRGLTIFVVLGALVVCSFVAFIFFRDDKEDNITPLCPQLVVQKKELRFVMDMTAIHQEGSQSRQIHVTEDDGKALCCFLVDVHNNLQPGAGGVAATARLLNSTDLMLATVVARNIPVAGQGLALCRSGCEIFGFVEPKGPSRFDIRHRTGFHLLTLLGDFSADADIEAVNPVGSTVASLRCSGPDGKWEGHVLQHIDAGLVLCSIVATQVYRRLSSSPQLNPWSEVPQWQTAETGPPSEPTVSQFAGLEPDDKNSMNEDDEGSADASNQAPGSQIH